MRTIKLPSTFKPKYSFPLIRMGSHRDGGYLVDERLVTSDLISFGISGDWQFERHWRNRNPSAVIETYDGSISGSKFLLTAFLSLFRPHKPKLVLRNLSTAVEYVTFLKNQTRFNKLFVGNTTQVNWISYQEVTRNTGCGAPFFLKVDIEGHEYEFLDEILDRQDMLAGLAIEFHQPLTHLETIENFIERLELFVCNVHPNNCLPKNDQSAEPSLEISFSRYEGLGQEPQVPHDLEADNDQTCESIYLQFEAE